jgi:hypothetical protein
MLAKRRFNQSDGPSSTPYKYEMGDPIEIKFKGTNGILCDFGRLRPVRSSKAIADPSE